MHSKNTYICVIVALLIPLAALAQMPPPETIEQGAKVYEAHCAMCHERPQDKRTPNRARLTMTRSPDYLVRVLTVGPMRQQGSVLSAEEKQAVAAYLMRKLPGSGSNVDLQANRCRRAAPPIAVNGSSWNGWGGRGPNNWRYQPDPGFTSAEVSRLKLKWVFAYPGSASSQPTIVGAHMFVPSMAGIVFSLDPDSGCTRWAVDLGVPIRTAISVGKLPSGKFAVYIGDTKGVVYSLDAENGNELWRTVVDEHPTARLTGAAMLFDGRLYQPVSSLEESYATDPNYVCCSFRGSLVALDAATGRVIWKTYTIDQAAKPLPDGHRSGPSGAAIWSTPTIDPKRRLIYAGTGNSYTDPAAPESDAVIAFDLETGAKRWVKQLHAGDAFVIGCQQQSKQRNCPQGEVGPDFDIGSSPLPVTMPTGKDVLIVTSKSGEVFALDIDEQGKIVWQTRVGGGGMLGGIEWGGASDGERIYAPISDFTPGEQPPRPGMNALSLTSGKLLWHIPASRTMCAWGTPCSNSLSSAPIVIPGVVFAASLDGHVRAYSATDGKIIWNFDTGIGFDAVNGAKAIGGSIDQGGQTIAGGRLFVSSGARIASPGNALLVFTVDGK